ncbi:MAG: hypothetical protein ABI968_08030 [Acidobacteriota bacterium]
MIAALTLTVAASLWAQQGATPTPGAAAKPATSPVDTSRSSMPAYQRTNTAKRMSSKPPASPSDCGGNAWRKFNKPGFTSQKDCEYWVQKHPRKSPSPAPAPPPNTH